MHTCPRCELKKRKPSASHPLKEPGKFINVSTAFSLGDHRSRRRSQILKNTIRPLKSTLLKSKQPYKCQRFQIGKSKGGIRHGSAIKRIISAVKRRETRRKAARSDDAPDRHRRRLAAHSDDQRRRNPRLEQNRHPPGSLARHNDNLEHRENRPGALRHLLERQSTLCAAVFKETARIKRRQTPESALRRHRRSGPEDIAKYADIISGVQIELKDEAAVLRRWEETLGIKEMMKRTMAIHSPFLHFCNILFVTL